MRKLVAAINMSLDGYCDHTSMTADEEIHEHYTELLNEADTILYGSITYGLMQYWQTFIETPSDEKSMNDFANAIDKISKIVFSNKLKNTDWASAQLAENSIEKEVKSLKKARNGGSKDILVGSRSIILQLMKLNLIDEYQLCIHPVVVGSGLPLFENITDRTVLKLIKTKTFSGGAIILYFEPNNE